MAEKLVKDAVRKILNNHGAYWFMPRGTGLGTSGIPDFICCHHGWFIGIETKSGKNKPTSLQEQQLKEIHKHRGFALVINENNLGALDRLLGLLTSTADIQADRLDDLLKANQAAPDTGETIGDFVDLVNILVRAQPCSP